jgi:anti-sigma B factor antagonist
MEINHRRLNRVDLLALHGRLDAASAPQLKEQIDSLLGQNRCRIVLDLSALEGLSSAGLRVLAEARIRARARQITDLEGGDVRLAGASVYIKELLDMTGFSTMFEIYPDALEAVGSF